MRVLARRCADEVGRGMLFESEDLKFFRDTWSSQMMCMVRLVSVAILLVVRQLQSDVTG